MLFTHAKIHMVYPGVEWGTLGLSWGSMGSLGSSLSVTGENGPVSCDLQVQEGLDFRKFEEEKQKIKKEM